MRYLSFFVALLSTCLTLSAQATLTATADAGGAYDVVAAAGFLIEGPDDSSSDCVGGANGSHSTFGDHITQTADADLAQNVFAFHSHLPEDNDRCLVFDRARIEIKGGPEGQTDPALEHKYGDTSHYRWHFRLADDFIGASSFTHLFQNKAAGGSDDGFPILTLTARSSVVELRHDAGSENAAGSLGRLADAPLDRFRGQWVEVTMRQVHTNNGSLDVTIRDLATGLPILLYANSNLDLWRGTQDQSALINRPKWGIYRSYNEAAGLQDETVRFANFCSSEGQVSQCPSLVPGSGAGPGAVTHALPADGSTDVPLTMPIVWRAHPAADSYRVYLGESATELRLDTSLTDTIYYPQLAAGTEYYYLVGAVSAEEESRTAVRRFSTLDQPNDGDWAVVRGHARPELEAPQFFELNTNLSGTQMDSVAPLGDREGNTAYCYFSGPKEGDNGNYRWRYRQDATDELTAVLRIAPLPEVNNLTYVEFYGLGWRQKIRINRSNIRFERTPDDPEIAFPEDFWADGQPRTLRFTFAANPTPGEPMLTTVYLDEGSEPFAGPFVSDEMKDGAFLDIGRAGSTDYGACFDFIAVNATGAFSPEDPTADALPTDLFGAPAAAPAYTLPLNGSIDVPLYMPIVWERGDGAQEYTVYLGTEANQLVPDTTLTGTSYVPDLMAATTYYYRVDAGADQGEVKSFTTLTQADDGAWEVARGHARPEVEAPQFFEFDTNLEQVGLDSVAPITDETGNNAYCFFSGPKEGDNGNYRWRYRQEEGEQLTLLLRLRALPDVDNITYVEFSGLGYRQKLRINRSTLRFEKTPDDPEVAFPEGFWEDEGFRVLRILFQDNPTAGEPMITSVYLEEADTLFATYVSDEESDNLYLDVGRAGSTDYGACLDYIAVNPQGAYAPGAGETFLPPADLVLPAGYTFLRGRAIPVSLQVYPNPAGSWLQIRRPEGEGAAAYRVTTLTGRLVADGMLQQPNHRIDVSSLPVGSYLLQTRLADSRPAMARFVKH